MDEAIIEWETKKRRRRRRRRKGEDEEGEDDGTGESPKHPPRLFIPNHTAWCGVPLAPPSCPSSSSGVTVPQRAPRKGK
jgi:hypothetical protein